MRLEHAIVAVLSLAIACGQTPACPAVSFRTSSVVSLTPSSTSHLNVARQQNGSWTAYELANSSPYRIIRTTPNFQNQLGPCAQFSGAVGPLYGTWVLDTARLSSGEYLFANVDGFTLFDRDMNFVSQSPYDLPVFNNELGTSLLAATSVTLADLNGDGIPDAIINVRVPDYGGGSLFVLLGKGGSSFGAPTQVYNTRALSGISGIAVTDVNADGIPDLLFSANESNIVLMAGNGDGTFQPAKTVASIPFELFGAATAADLNGDGKPDLVFTSTPASGLASLWVALASGNGTFAAPVSYPVADADGVAIADMNGDGNPDIVTDGVSILFGDGTGKFPSRQDYAGQTFGSVILTDFNGDGRIDIVIGSGKRTILSGLALEVLYGRADGTWSGAPVTPVTGIGPNGYQSLAAADFNGDGIPDLVYVTDELLPALSILTGSGSGTFQPAYRYTPASGVPVSAIAADFNRDGISDAALAVTGPPDRVEILLGKGDGTLAPSLDISVPHGVFALASADFNGDGNPDLAVLISSENGADAEEVVILLGDGRGDFTLKGTWPAGPLANALIIADLNGDGKPDIAVANTDSQSDSNGHVSLLLGKGDGTFTAGKSIPLSPALGVGPFSIVTADFNRDGILDLAVGLQTYGGSAAGTAVLLGAGDATFQPPAFYPNTATQLFAADMNGDGLPDLVLAGGPPGSINAAGGSVLLSNGDGTFQTVPFPFVPVAVVADFNRDGHPDVASATPLSSLGIAAYLNTTATAAPVRIASAAAGVPPPLAPGSLATVYGTNLASGTASAAGTDFPTSLAGAGVSVRDAAGMTRAAQLLYASPDQIDFLTPAATARGGATVTITTNSSSGTLSQSAHLEIASVAPSLFTFDSADLAAGYAISAPPGSTPTVKQLFTTNNGHITAAPLDVSSGYVSLVLFGTGIRNAASNNVTVSLQGLPGVVTYSGPQQTIPGLDQVNVLLPRGLAGSGLVNIVLTANGVDSNTVSITVR